MYLNHSLKVEFTDSSFTQWYLFCVSEKDINETPESKSQQNCTKNDINILLFFWTTSLYTAACLIVTNHNNA